MHGMAKMQAYILLYGCAENFHGGTGESAHKVFVKAPGLKTQRRVGEFAVQTAKQYHHTMIARHAYMSMSFGNDLVNDRNSSSDVHTSAMDGKYSIDMSSTMTIGKRCVGGVELVQQSSQDIRAGDTLTTRGIKQYFMRIPLIEDHLGMTGRMCISLKVTTRRCFTHRRFLDFSTLPVVSRQ